MRGRPPPWRKHTWAEQIDRYRTDVALVEYRMRVCPELAAQVDVSSLSVLDLIDMDEEPPAYQRLSQNTKRA
ncbi:MAG TPA: hypothetical protein VK901_14260 [Nitrospiraceae bacterium]|nr:hypothetical protein [Nitrospiraceae bacterium]